MLPNNLYKLLKDTISGEAAISTPKNSENDSAHLWHLRLGHINERTMEVLHKRKIEEYEVLQAEPLQVLRT